MMRGPSPVSRLSAILMIGLFLGLTSGAGADSDFEQGQRAYDAKNYDTAMDVWSRAAAEGDGRAQYSLALMLANGVGRPKDVISAYAWLKLAEENGIEGAREMSMILEREHLPRYCLYDALRLVSEFKRGQTAAILAGGRHKSRCWTYHRDP